VPNGNAQVTPSNGDRKYKISATRNAKDNYSFQLTDINGGPPNLVFNKDTDNLRRKAYYLLEFHLHNEQGCDLEFVDDRSKVLSACPEHEGVNGCAPEGSEFLPIVYVHPTKPLGKRLIYVINTDPDIENFFFGFSFVSRDGAEKAYFDPGGTNQNGGISAAYLVVGPLTGAVVGLGTAMLANNTLVPSATLLFGLGGAVVGLITGYILGRR